MIPDWMNQTEAGSYHGAASEAKKKGFAKKTVDGVLGFFQESLISEAFAKRKGLLQSLDPRVKLISMFVLVVGVTFMTSPWVLLVIYLLTLVLAYFSKIEVLWFVKRVWVFIPIFAGVIVIPILFNVFLAGDVLVPIATLGNGSHLGPIALPSSIYITRQGTIYVVTFILRVAACVSLAILLFLTTQRDLLFKSMRTLYVPKVYISHDQHVLQVYLPALGHNSGSFYGQKEPTDRKPAPAGRAKVGRRTCWLHAREIAGHE